MLTTLDYTGRPGHVDFLPHILTDLTKNDVSWRISDHYPLWAEFTAQPATGRPLPHSGPGVDSMGSVAGVHTADKEGPAMSAAIETYWEDSEWHNRRQGDDQPFSSGGTKDEAVTAGREEAIADQVEHIIKNQDGRIGERNSYGNDPRNIPG